MRPRALVTGASRRVGRAIAIELARRGCDLLLTCRRQNDDMEQTRHLAREAARAGSAGSGPEVTAVELDLADADAVERFGRSQGRERWDILVHNAALYSPSARDAGAAHSMMTHASVNAAAPLALSLALAPALAASSRPGGGSIVCLGDIHAQGRPVSGYTAYLMSKAAVHQMVESLAVELAPSIRVNAVLPGVVAWPDDVDAERRHRYESKIPLSRPGTPEDAAGAVAWLALEATYVTGTLLRVDGGRWLR